MLSLTIIFVVKARCCYLDDLSLNVRIVRLFQINDKLAPNRSRRKRRERQTCVRARDLTFLLKINCHSQLTILSLALLSSREYILREQARQTVEWQNTIIIVIALNAARLSDYVHLTAAALANFAAISNSNVMLLFDANCKFTTSCTNAINSNSQPCHRDKQQNAHWH